MKSLDFLVSILVIQSLLEALTPRQGMPYSERFYEGKCLTLKGISTLD